MIIDPLSLFNSKVIKGINAYKVEKKNLQRLVKFSELRQVLNKNTTFIIGTSRSNNFLSKDLEIFTGDNVYNLSLAGSSPYEQYHYIKYILENFQINYIVYSFDFFSYNPLAKPADDFSIDRIEQNSLKQDYINSLLSIDGIMNSFKTLQNNIFKIKTKELEYNELKFNNTLNGFRKTKSLYNSKEFQNPDSIQYQMEYLKKTFKLIENHNIKIKAFITPISCEQYKLIYQMNLGSTYTFWKEELSHLTPYYDFSGCNDITMNRKNFHDSSHILPSVGSIIFKQIFHFNKELGFGQFVDKTK